MDIKDIKTIAIDVDGTLFNEDSVIMPKTKKALLELQDKGIHIILCSGRPVKSMLDIAEEMGLKNHHGVVVSNNGAVGYDVRDHKVIYDTPIDHDLAVEVLKSFEGRNIWPMVEDGDYMLVSDVYEGVVTLNDKLMNITEIEARAGHYLLKESKEIYNEIDFNVNKILTIVEPAETEEIVKEYQEKYGDRLYVVQTAPFYMEFMRPEISKAYGLKKLGIDPDTLMSFGDSMNDREMLVYSKYPVAMGNAQQPVKDAAIYVTSDNNNEGIYEALKHFGLVE